MTTPRSSTPILFTFSLLIAGWAQAQPVVVSSADPPSAQQGTVLQVVIAGRGFEQGAVARFFASGTGNPSGVNVLGTTFVSKTQLIADVAVDEGALISLYDIEVELLSGRRGKGTELFAVVQPGGGGGAATCELPGDPPAGFTLLDFGSGGFEGLRLPTATASAEFGRQIEGQQVSGAFALGGVVDYVDPIFFAVTSRDHVSEKGLLHFYLLDPGTSAIRKLDHVANFEADESASAPHEWAIRILRRANFDGNEIPDFVAANRASGSVRILLGKPDYCGGNICDVIYTASELLDSHSILNFGGDIAVGDRDPDGVDDILAVGAWGGGKNVPGSVFLYGALTGTPPLAMPPFAPTEFDQIQSEQSGDNFGMVAFGHVNDDNLLDLIVGAPFRKVGKMRNAGEVLWFPGPLSSGSVGEHLMGGSNSEDRLGFQVHATPAFGSSGILDTDDIVATTRWSADDPRAEVINTGTAKATALRPTLDGGGWSTRGVHSGDANENGMGNDILIGTPNRNCGESGTNANVGAAYLYLDGSEDPVVFEPLTTDDEFHHFGWGGALLSGAGHSFVLLGEPGRNIDGIVDAGQVYIYQYTGN